MDQKWVKAADKVAKAIPAQYRVVGFNRERPIFVSEADWPWPDGRYWLVTNWPKEEIDFMISGFNLTKFPHEFSSIFDAERRRDWLNRDVAGPHRKPFELGERRPVDKDKLKGFGDKSLPYNRGLTARPRPGKRSA